MRGRSFVANLIAKAPLAGPGTLTIGGLTLRCVEYATITSIAPFQGQEAEVGKALKGLGFPDPNRVLHNGAVRIVWTGRGQAFLIGPVPEGLEGLAALCDQSDGWACFSLRGDDAADCLMRLIPLDLRAMQAGQAARAPLNHMQAVIMREADGFELMIFRSMAQTGWHEISTAMKAMAARATLQC
jgi:sarcosine oxidase subunit gamma